jgi:uncharacterized protein (TIGR02118 family)
MAQRLVLYNAPANPAAFNRFGHQTHIPLAQKIPGLSSYLISRGPVQAVAGTAPHLIATLQFDSRADLNATLASPEGQAAAGDLPNFASAGSTVLIQDTQAL